VGWQGFLNGIMPISLVSSPESNKGGFFNGFRNFFYWSLILVGWQGFLNGIMPISLVRTPARLRGKRTPVERAIAPWA
jgi:hypothetical protein